MPNDTALFQPTTPTPRPASRADFVRAMLAAEPPYVLHIPVRHKKPENV